MKFKKVDPIKNLGRTSLLLKDKNKFQQSARNSSFLFSNEALKIQKQQMLESGQGTVK